MLDYDRYLLTTTYSKFLTAWLVGDTLSCFSISKTLSCKQPFGLEVWTITLPIALPCNKCNLTMMNGDGKNWTIDKIINNTIFADTFLKNLIWLTKFWKFLSWQEELKRKGDGLRGFTRLWRQRKVWRFRYRWFFYVVILLMKLVWS